MGRSANLLDTASDPPRIPHGSLRPVPPVLPLCLTDRKWNKPFPHEGPYAVSIKLLLGLFFLGLWLIYYCWAKDTYSLSHDQQ